MKLISLLLFLLVFQEALCQTTLTIQGQVTDKSTNKPLAYVNLYLAGTNFGTVTNQAGNFILKYQATSKSDTVVLSHLGYKPFKISLKNNTTEYLVVALEPQPLAIKEIVVKPINPLDIVYNCLVKIPQNYNLNSHTVQGFQREYVKQADKYIQLLEAAFRTESKGSDGGQSSIILNARYIEDKKEKAPLWSASRGGFYTFGWTAVSGMVNPVKSNFLGINIKKKSDLAKYYEFQLKESTRFNNQEVYVIAFDQKRNVRRPLLKGFLYIDSELDAIVKLTYELSPRGLKYLKSHETCGGQKLSKTPKKIDIKKDSYEITYRKYGSKWYLNTYVIDTEFDASLVFFRMIQSQKNSLSFHSERIVTAIDTTTLANKNPATNIADIGSIPTPQNYIKKNFENYEEVNEEKWTNLNLIQSDTSIASIAKQLKRNNQQWELHSQKQTLEKAIAKSNYTARQLTEDVDYLKETLEKVHPGLYWYTDKGTLDKEFKIVKDKLTKKNSEADFFQLLSPVIEKIHCGHTYLNPSVVKTEYQQYNKLFPLDLWIKGDSAVVIASNDNIPKGTRIRAINSYEMPEIVNRIKSCIAADGFNVTYKEFLLNTKFSSLFARHFSSKDTFDIKIEDVNGQVKNVKVIGRAGNKAESEKIDSAQFLIQDFLQTAILTPPSFSGNQDLPKFLERSFAQIKSKNLKNLIIDLRNNQGGRDEYGLLLFSYLARAPFRYYQNISVATRDTTVLNRLKFGEVPFQAAIPDYISNVQEQNSSYFYTAHANLGIHQPNANAFTESVYILINGGTFSTAAEFAAIAHTNRRAVFIGQETGGGYYGNCSLGMPTLTLPNSQIRITIPLAKYELAVSQSSPVGHGVIPDYPTRYSSQDILGSRDKDLDICLKMIREGKN